MRQQFLLALIFLFGVVGVYSQFEDGQYPTSEFSDEVSTELLKRMTRQTHGNAHNANSALNVAHRGMQQHLGEKVDGANRQARGQASTVPLANRLKNRQSTLDTRYSQQPQQRTQQQSRQQTQQRTQNNPSTGYFTGATSTQTIGAPQKRGPKRAGGITMYTGPSKRS